MIDDFLHTVCPPNIWKLPRAVRRIFLLTLPISLPLMIVWWVAFSFTLMIVDLGRLISDAGEWFGGLLSRLWN